MSVLLSWLLLACTSSEPPEAVSASEVLAQRYAEEPEAVRAEVLAIEDPVVQEAAVLAIMEAHPAEIGPLCADLPTGPVADRCERYAARAHLWTSSELQKKRRPAREAAPRAGGGPGGLNAVLPPALASEPDLSGVIADAGTCGASDLVCLEQAAELAATAGEPTTALSRCRVLPEGRTQEDCAFRAAELLTQELADYPRALALCRAAGAYAQQCHGHVLLSLRNKGFLSLDVDSLASAAAIAEHLDGLWREQSPDFALLTRQRWWAAVLVLRPVGGVQELSAALETVPEEIRPLLHVHFAWLALDASDPLATAQALLRGEDLALPPPPSVDSLQRRNLWIGDFPEEELIPAVLMPANLGGRRPTSSDVDMDLRLALIELHSRAQEPDVDAILALTAAETQSESDAALLAWCRARVLAEVAPEHSALAALRDHADARVARRASNGFREAKWARKGTGASP